MGSYDSKALTNMSEDVDTSLTEEQKIAAARLCAAYAQGTTLQEQVADAEALWLALGVHPRYPVDDESSLDSAPRRLAPLQ